MTYKQTRNYENQQHVLFDGIGQYDIPQIHGCNVDVDDCEWLSFNYALSSKDRSNKVCHFYLDDYQFERLWNNPYKYVDVLTQFRAVTSPDFSLFSDFPLALQVYNHFRKHWLGAFYESCGVNVIPTICWSDEKSFDFCFDGEPKNSIITLSDVGCLQNKKSKEMFYDGFFRTVEELNPSKIYLYTSEQDLGRFENNNLPVKATIKVIKNENVKRLRRIL